MSDIARQMIASMFFLMLAFSLVPMWYNGDEQAPRLAPEKCDFMATYTLGATMRQITYYQESRSVSWLVGWSQSMSARLVSVSVSQSHSRPTTLSSTAVYMSPDLYSDSMYADVFASSNPRVLLPKRPLLPHLDVGISIFSCSTSSAGFPICNPYDFMIIWHFSDLFLPFYAFLSCFLLFLMFTFVLPSPFGLDRILDQSNCL